MSSQHLCIHERLQYKMNKIKQRYTKNNSLSEGSDDSLHIVFWNAGGLNYVKFSEFKTILSKYNADVFIIVEAGASTDSPHLYEVANFNINVLVRSRQVASGILVGVSRRHARRFSVIHEMEDGDKLEAVSLDVYCDGIRYSIVGLYNPPNNKPNFDCLSTLAVRRNTVILGDFNAHSARWGYSTTNAAGRATEDLLDDLNLLQLKSEPTFLSYGGHRSTPDLAIVHPGLSARTDLYLADACDGCGHRPLVLNIKTKKLTTQQRQLSRWNFKKGNWCNFSNFTNELVTDALKDDNPDKSTDRFINAVIQAAKKSIPRGQVKRYKPFWNATLTALKESRNKARKKAETTQLLSDCIELRKKQAELRKSIIKEKRQTYRQFVANLDFRRDGIKAHNFLSSLNNDRKTHQWEPVKVNGRLLTTPRDIAAALCKRFTSVGRLHTDRDERRSAKHVTSSCPSRVQHSLFNESFSLAELDVAIHTLKKRKSAGPDGIFPEFLKNLGRDARQTLLKLINLTWEKHIPHHWKKADVIAILKKGKPADNLASFRPISLTSVICKTTEKMVEKRLRQHLESVGAVSDCQAGFRQHRCTIDQVVKFTQAVKDGFHHRQSTLAVFIDFKAAYDGVWRDLLIHKLSKHYVSGNMLKWIKQFLSQRFIRTSFQGSTSRYKQVHQGLPQGAVLSCLLFNVMIDDLQHAIEKIPGVSCLLYADDVVIWATSSNINSLQSTINEVLHNVSYWCNINKMVVNTEKTLYELFTLSTKPHSLRILFDDSELKRSYNAKYLGVILDHRLSWSCQIQSTAEKAQKRTNLLKRLTATKWGATQDVLSTTYKTYVRPTMEYASELICLSSSTPLNRLEVVQNNALRTITGAAKSTPIAAMQLQTDIEPLCIRRDKSTLKFWERARRIDSRHWDRYSPASSRLKTQTSPLVHAENLRARYNLLLDQPAELRMFYNVLPSLPVRSLSLLNFDRTKALSSPHVLRIAALETIEGLYGGGEWLHIYTDGSALPRATGAGYYCSLFEGSVPVGSNASNYDGEIVAIYRAVERLLTTNYEQRKVVFLVDSQAAINALTENTPTDCESTSVCRELLSGMVRDGWSVVLQWIPSHVGVLGNERADQLAKQGTSLTQPDNPSSLTSAKNKINNTLKAYTRSSLKELSSGKQWEDLAYKREIPYNLPRAEAVAKFRLKTGHDYLKAHLHRIGLADTDNCPLCESGRMDGPHLEQCGDLADFADRSPSSLYWEARRRMAEMPRAGIG